MNLTNLIEELEEFGEKEGLVLLEWEDHLQPIVAAMKEAKEMAEGYHLVAPRDQKGDTRFSTATVWLDKWFKESQE